MQDKIEKLFQELLYQQNLVSNLITKAGADRVVTVDLHAGQIQGFFDIPVDNLFATPIFARHARKKIKSKKIICVAPDVGGTERARALGKLLRCWSCYC